MEAPWSRLLGLIASTYVIVNALFALLYLLGGDAIVGAERGSFTDAYFFSVQTLSTVGYGVMSPKGVYGSALVTLEAFVGLLGPGTVEFTSASTVDGGVVSGRVSGQVVSWPFGAGM